MHADEEDDEHWWMSGARPQLLKGLTNLHTRFFVVFSIVSASVNTGKKGKQFPIIVKCF
jgi:hypothetical protein